MVTAWSIQVVCLYTLIAIGLIPMTRPGSSTFDEPPILVACMYALMCRVLVVRQYLYHGVRLRQRVHTVTILHN